MFKTIRMVDRISDIDPEGTRINGIFIYSPFPGTKLYDIVVNEFGFVPPNSLDDWAKFEPYDTSNSVRLSKKKKAKPDIISILARFFFTAKTLSCWRFSEKISRHGGLLKTVASLIFNGCFYPIALFRWKIRFFGFGYEWKLWQAIFFSFMGRK